MTGLLGWVREPEPDPLPHSVVVTLEMQADVPAFCCWDREPDWWDARTLADSIASQYHSTEAFVDAWGLWGAHTTLTILDSNGVTAEVNLR